MPTKLHVSVGEPPIVRSLTLNQREDVSAGLQWILSTFATTTIVAIDSYSGRIHARWLNTTTLKAVATWALGRNRTEWNLYFVVNSPIQGLSKKPTKNEIEALRAAAIADVDAKDGRNMDQALTAIMALPVAPSITIMSGGGYQPIWLLPQPIPANDEAVARSDALSRRIAELTDGDAVQNVDRILRVPFTLNHPNKKKREAGRVTCPSGLLESGEPT